MNEEEKKAIELLENIKDNSWTTKYIMSSDSKNAEIVLNLIEKLQKDIEGWKSYSEELEETNTEISNKKYELEFEVEKLQKEIEELKENKTGLEEEIQEQAKNLIQNEEYITKECILKEKVKDKIEELKNNALIIIKQNDKYYYETNKYNKIVIQVLQELIEEREEK